MIFSGLKKSVLLSALGLGLTFGCSSSDDQQSSSGEALEVSQQESPASYEDGEETLEQTDAEEVTELSSTPVEDFSTSEPEVYQPDQTVADQAQEESLYQDNSSSELISLDEKPVEYVEETTSLNEPVQAEESTELTSVSADNDISSNAYTDTSSSEVSSDNMNYRVVRGDTVSLVARKIYGSIAEWRQIAQASSLSNPHLIYPGNTLVVPLINEHARSFANSYGSKMASNNQGQGDNINITVKRGDTLSTLASQYLGNENAWQEIFQQNSGRINDPNMIYEGQTLSISRAQAH